MSHNPWLDVPNPCEHARLRLFCFPHAGAGPSPYRLWSKGFGPQVEVCLVALPGRERRRREALPADLTRLVEEALPFLERECRTRPFMFFGHSMGAVVAYEMARALQARHGLSPQRLFLSARGPERRDHELLHVLSDEALLDALGNRYNGLPSALLADPGLVDFFLPILRADLALIETHESPPAPLLECPITAIGGRDDEGAPADGLRRWGARTRGDFELHMLAGDHFYLFSHADALFEVVRPRLESRWRSETTPARTTTPMICVAFPGQGSQRKGMGADLFDRFPDICRTADAVLGYSIRELCVDDAGGRLKQTRYTQPALFTVNAMTYLASGITADVLAGHSLGEYNALLAAGCFDFETGLRLVQKRGELMGKAANGSMAAVVGLAASRIEELVALHAPEVDLANYNAPDQVVLSGPVKALEALEAPTKQAGGRYLMLNVSAAFHSRYMAEAAAEFERFLTQFELRDPLVPVLANVTARPYAPGQVARLLAEQIRRPVRWADIVDDLLGRGVTELVEAGPGRVLTGLWRVAASAPRIERVPERVEAVPPPPVNGTARAPKTEVKLDARAVRSAADEDRSSSHATAPPRFRAESLGSARFRQAHGLRYAYLAGTCAGIGGAAAVLRLGQRGLVGFLETVNQTVEALAAQIDEIGRTLAGVGRFGVNLTHTPETPQREERLVELFLQREVALVEATGFLEPTAALVEYAFRGAAARPRRLLVRVARPDVAAAFLRPPATEPVDDLLRRGRLTATEAERARRAPLATDICADSDAVEAGEGPLGTALLPAIVRLRDELATDVTVGAAGSLGSPEALAAAFLLMAEFVVTDSVNLCTPESPLSDTAKDMLADLDIHDTGYAPALEMFELGTRTQVARKGTLFCARANRLYELYRQHASLDDLDARTRALLERSYFRMPLDEAWHEARQTFLETRPDEVERADRNARQKMALLFKLYLHRAAALARAGDPSSRVDYQLPASPAMGAFNHTVKGSELAPWRARHVDLVAERLMQGAATFLEGQLRRLMSLHASHR